MKIAIATECSINETRVAISPTIVKKYIDLGISISIENNAGIKANFTNQNYIDAGATIENDLQKLLNKTDIFLSVLRPNLDKLKYLPSTSIVIGMLNPYAKKTEFSNLKKTGHTSFAMELIPRISRSQSMDVLSSQSNLSGYKAVLEAISKFGRVFPMMMTAAGTIPPAKVFIMGVGVAGLQAIATAKRLGAIVTATDVRIETKEQVESLGAKFIMIESNNNKDKTSEINDNHKERQNQLIIKHIKKQDIIITTALILGRPAPEIISKKMVESMKIGSIIVDLSTLQGKGNCSLSIKDKIIIHKGIKIIGYSDLAKYLPEDSSNFYARNLLNFVILLLNKDKTKIDINWNDEIIKSTLLTQNGKLIKELCL